MEKWKEERVEACVYEAFAKSPLPTARAACLFPVRYLTYTTFRGHFQQLQSSTSRALYTMYMTLSGKFAPEEATRRRKLKCHQLPTVPYMYPNSQKSTVLHFLGN